MLRFPHLNRRVRRASILIALVLTLVLTALPSTVMAAPVYGHTGYSQHSCGGCYVVQPGDTLTKIARWYGVSVRALASFNGISNPSKIYVGQKLYIPQGHYGHNDGGYGHNNGGYGHNNGGYGQGDGRHVLQRGDTLSQIAKWYGVSVSYLCHKNGISNPSKIYVGQVIHL